MLGARGRQRREGSGLVQECEGQEEWLQGED